MTETFEQKPTATVLVCEDESALRELIRISLGPAHRYVEADDGREAVRLAREERPDLVVLDLMIPGLPGLEVLRALRSDPATAATRVIVISAWSDVGGEALAAGADAFVAKPFEPDGFRAQVEELLAA